MCIAAFFAISAKHLQISWHDVIFITCPILNSLTAFACIYLMIKIYYYEATKLWFKRVQKTTDEDTDGDEPPIY